MEQLPKEEKLETILGNQIPHITVEASRQATVCF